jgi:2'-5' RNA ligase
MRAAFALLVDHRVHNAMRKLAVEFHARYGTGLLAAVLPPHISLKQPFAVHDLAALETYLDELARSLEPVDIALTRLELQVTASDRDEVGVLWLAVAENPALRELHDRINRELAGRFGDTRAQFDGPDYRFHATVALGGPPPDVYRDLYDHIRDLDIDLSYTATHIALFYEADGDRPGRFITYKILPLGRQVR